MKVYRWAVAVGLAVLLALGADGAQGAEAQRQVPLLLTLTGYRGPETAGLLMAEVRGYFADVGLDVEIRTPETPLRPIKYVLEGVDDMGVSHQPQLLLARERGTPIEAVGSLLPQPTAAMIWLERSGLQGIADLRGKIVAIPGLSFQERLLESALKQAGVARGDVCIRTVRYQLVPSLVAGGADAIFGGTWNVEGMELESRDLDPVVLRTDDLGIPAYEEQVFFATTEFVSEHPREIRAFISALRRGTAAAIGDPEEAARELEASSEANTELSLREMEAGVEATLPLLSRTGRMSPARASRLEDWMLTEGFVRTRAAGS